MQVIIKYTRALWVVLICGAIARPAGAAADLSKLTLEELMNIEVTSAARKEQRLSDVAAAMYVITPEEIRRSGATSIPGSPASGTGGQRRPHRFEQMGDQREKIYGFLCHKLVVLINGRSVYPPLVSGVYWDVPNTLLKEFEPFEVDPRPA